MDKKTKEYGHLLNEIIFYKEKYPDDNFSIILNDAIKKHNEMETNKIADKNNKTNKFVLLKNAMIRIYIIILLILETLSIPLVSMYGLFFWVYSGKNIIITIDNILTSYEKIMPKIKK